MPGKSGNMKRYIVEGIIISELSPVFVVALPWILRYMYLKPPDSDRVGEAKDGFYKVRLYAHYVIYTLFCVYIACIC